MATKVAWVWQTARSWWEYYCDSNGYANGHLARWFDFYFMNGAWQWEYYGTWTRYDNDNSGCWHFWNATNLASYSLCP